MVALGEHCGDLDGHGAIMGIMHGGSRTPISVVRSCGMDVTPRKALRLEHIWKPVPNHSLSTKG